MTAADEVRAMFAGHSFGPPCAPADIHLAETALGETLPLILRELYLAFDGFRGSTDAQFFWPLFGRDGLVEMNQSFRGPEDFPRELVSKCLFFGDEGTGPQWGLKRDLPDKVIRWDAEWGSDFEIAGDNPVDVWRAKKEQYECLDDQP